MWGVGVGGGGAREMTVRCPRVCVVSPRLAGYAVLGLPVFGPGSEEVSERLVVSVEGRGAEVNGIRKRRQRNKRTNKQANKQTNKQLTSEENGDETKG